MKTLVAVITQLHNNFFLDMHTICQLMCYRFYKYLDGSFPFGKFISHVDEASNTDCDKQGLHERCVVNEDLDISTTQHDQGHQTLQ